MTEGKAHTKIRYLDRFTKVVEVSAPNWEKAFAAAGHYIHNAIGDKFGALLSVGTYEAYDEKYDADAPVCYVYITIDGVDGE